MLALAYGYYVILCTVYLYVILWLFVLPVCHFLFVVYVRVDLYSA